MTDYKPALRDIEYCLEVWGKLHECKKLLRIKEFDDVFGPILGDADVRYNLQSTA